MGPRTVKVEPIHWPNTRPRDEEIAEVVEWFKQRKRRLSRRANTRATPTTAPIIWAARTYQNLKNFNRCRASTRGGRERAARDSRARRRRGARPEAFLRPA